MKKLLLLILILLQTGCIFYFESDDPSSRRGDNGRYDYYDSIWIESAEVYCDQGNGYYPTYWYLEAVVNANYEYYTSEIDVGVFADGDTYYRMDHNGYGLWTTTLRANYFLYCSEITYFNFVAQDVYGNYDELLVW